MDISKRLKTLERRAEKHGIRMDDACREAGLDYTTYWRWKNSKTSPTLEAWERLRDAVNALCEKAAA